MNTLSAENIKKRVYKIIKENPYFIGNVTFAEKYNKPITNDFEEKHVIFINGNKLVNSIITELSSEFKKCTFKIDEIKDNQYIVVYNIDCDDVYEAENRQQKVAYQMLVDGLRKFAAE